ncbi:MAG: hypothetical protein AAF934_07280, partial [Bacteroidota bacterium]
KIKKCYICPMEPIKEPSLILPKLRVIKNETGVNWMIVIRAAEETASDGVINVSAAINWINIRHRVCLN